MTSPAGPSWVAAQIIAACELGVHDPQTQPRTDQLEAARIIVGALTQPHQINTAQRQLAAALDQQPTTQTLFPTP